MGLREPAGDDDALAFQREITRELAAAGVPVLAGSDSGIVVANILPGWALHRELELLAEAGMTAHEVLVSATALSGDFLAPNAQLGTIAVGAPADLVLLAENPLEDVSHTRSIEAVVTRGTYFDRPALDALLESVEARMDVARTFQDMLRDRGIGGAAEWARAEQAAGRPVPGEASLLVAAYHRATAGNSAEAIALAELACELHPRSYRSAHLLAGLFELAGEIELAREAFEWALELRPDHPWLPAHIERLGG